jgi:hypothetical protein
MIAARTATTVTLMTTGHDPPPSAQLAVVRPRDHVENVRADAIRATAEIAAASGDPQRLFIADAIAWALGEHDTAPFTGKPNPAGANRSDVEAEIAQCRSFLHNTPWSESEANRIDEARAALKILEWLTGSDDRPPTYCPATQPGDLVGGRGRIVRSDAQIRSMLALAQAKLASDQTSHALGADWHHGVIQTLRWVLGERTATPTLGTVRSGLPDGARIAIEQSEAEDQLAGSGTHSGIAYHYADAIACTCRWLLGGTTRQPVTQES